MYSFGYSNRNDHGGAGSPYGKAVMSNDMVAHTWANPRGPGDFARSNNGNFYFNGATIYSYGSHFPVARIVEKPRKGKLVLFNSASYSVSTSQHQSAARSAARHLPNIAVEDIMADSRDAHRKNFDLFLKGARDAAASANRARAAWSIGWRHRDTLEKIVGARRYAAFFGYKWKIPADLIEIEKIFEAAQAERAAEEEKVRERERAAAQKALKKAIPAFRNGETLTPEQRAALYHEPPMLRTRGDIIQTSQGAEFPTADAIRAWPLLKRIRGRVLQSGQPWRRNGEQVPLGQFQIDLIGPEQVVAGCHKVHWSEIERMAKELGLEV